MQKTLSISLIKEYLATHKLYKTLEAFQLEIAETPTISSRKALAKELGISKKVYENKDKSLSELEILVGHVTLKLAQKRGQQICQNPIPKPLIEMNTVESRFVKEISVELIEDLDVSDCDVPSPQKTKPVPIIDFHSSEQSQFYSLLFPNNSRFPPEWKGKGFQFQSAPNPSYGLVQLKGGPCGLYASIQAIVLKYLIYEHKSMTISNLRPSPAHTKRALVETLADVIWKAGNGNAKLVLAKAAGGIDNISKSLGYSIHFNKSSLKEAITSQYSQFYHQENHGNGIIQLLFSVIYTRGFDRIRKDMDSFSESLIGRHSYCTQDMVNLLLYGKAISNLHDGDIDLDGQILHGINQKCDIGQLSLFEYYDNFKIGEHCKNPTVPIFVVCSESHYTVLFSFEQRGQQFDVYYYDELGNQTEDIRLTLKIGKKVGEDGQLVPPIEQCLQTKYGKDVLVDWNETEPLL